MPKNRQRASEKGAKSIAIRTKFKLGNRKSGLGCKQLSKKDLQEMRSKVSKRDRNMLMRTLESRGVLR